MNKNSRVKEARKKKGMNQKDLAIQMGVSQAYISKLEINEDYKFDQANKLAKILGVSPEWLLTDEKKNTTDNTTEGNEKIESLREMLRSKDETIEGLKQANRSKDEIIDILRGQIADLKDRLIKFEDQSKDQSKARTA